MGVLQGIHKIWQIERGDEERGINDDAVDVVAIED